ncbi:GntR family transcriptional regulator [Paraburkholderia nemoris]|uniref:GntR family transcriptional regulator n=1 Tax=Paraburkholderia nemoris TaxID=2793076 RepID=UPI0038BAB22F
MKNFGPKGDAMPPLVVRRGLTDHVYDQIKEQIFESRYGRDGRISIDALASELGVSRQPVLDSLKRLSFEGFVTIVPQVGSRVREYTNEEIDDFYRLFAFAEGLVAELAAARATTDDIASIREISDRIGRLTSSGSARNEQAKRYRLLNRELHKEIRRIARSSSVTEIVESMGDRSDFFIATSGRPMVAESLMQAHDEHESIVDAISRHDVKTASKAMKIHILETNARLQQFLATSAAASA